MRSWLNRRWYDCVYLSAWTGLTLGWSVRVAGRRNMPMTGPALLISNHQSYLDPLLIGMASPRLLLTYLARLTLFRNPALRWFIKSMGAIPIDKEGIGRAGLQLTLDCLQRGEAVLVFPEGNRTHDGNLHPFEPGISLLVKKVQAPIVPIGIAGVYQAWSRHMTVPRPAPIFLGPSPAALGVCIGKPIQPAALAGMKRDEKVAALHAEVAKCVAAAERLRKKP